LKKFLSFYFSLYIIFIFSFCFPTDVCAIEGEQRLYISKTGEMWNDYVNMMNIVFPGGKISGLYYHKLYAEYDPDVGGFVIIDKVPSHVSYTKEVGLASFGLCFSEKSAISLQHVYSATVPVAINLLQPIFFENSNSFTAE